MAIKKIKPKSPDPYLSKTIGDNTLARIAHVNQLVDQINSNDPRPYKVYTALLTQTGTTSPTAIVLENTFEFEPVWEFVDDGIYGFDFPTTPDFNKIVIFGRPFLGLINIYKNSERDINITSSEGNESIVDYSIEIRVYN